jgi:hypothetical protein
VTRDARRLAAVLLEPCDARSWAHMMLRALAGDLLCRMELTAPERLEAQLDAVALRVRAHRLPPEAFSLTSYLAHGAPVAAAAADTADAGMLAVGVGGAAAPADAVPNAPAPAMAPVVDAPKTLVTTLGLRGPAALVLAEMMHEHPQLHMQLSSTWDAIVRHLGPSPTERLLHAIGELVNLCLAQPPCTNSVPSSVTRISSPSVTSTSSCHSWSAFQGTNFILLSSRACRSSGSFSPLLR